MLTKSILKSTKKVLSIHENDPSFDQDIMLHINGVFATLQQLGVGPDSGFMIDDDEVEWDTYLEVENQTILNLVKVYTFLQVRILFDPPAAPGALDAMKSQLEEKGWRLHVMAEDARSNSD